MSVSEHPTCVVIRGGPAGMTLGPLLTRTGIQLTVLKKHADFLPEVRGEDFCTHTVRPSTLGLLDELRLGEPFAKLPHSTLHKLAFPIDEHRKIAMADFRRLEVPHLYITLGAAVELAQPARRSWCRRTELPAADQYRGNGVGLRPKHPPKLAQR